MVQVQGQRAAVRLRHAAGDVVADDSYFPFQRWAPGWEQDDLVTEYGAPVSALTVNDNVVYVRIMPADRPGEKAFVAVEPYADYYHLDNRVMTTPPGTGPSRITISREPGAKDVLLWGTIPQDDPGGTQAIAIADPAVCPIANPDAGALAIVPVRGDDVVYRIRTTADGALACNGCDTALASTGWADAFTAGIACGPGIARAYVGYLRSSIGQAVFSQLDLTKGPGDPGFLQTASFGLGAVNAYAYDAPRKRLYFTRTATGAAGTLAFVDLANDCSFDPSRGGVACPGGQAVAPNGVELRGIVLSTSETTPRRAYMTARIFDSIAAASSGVRIGDFDGLLIVADLVENLFGRLELRIVNELPIGYGAAEIVLLPARAGKRDVVAALAADDAILWIYDDETGECWCPTPGPMGRAATSRVAVSPVASADQLIDC